MHKGLIEYDWKNIDEYSDEEISYFLFLEGKSVGAISKIRNIDRETIQNHIIVGKIKYRFLAKSKNAKELLKSISKAGKDDKKALLSSLGDKKDELIKYIRNNYVNLYSEQKQTAIWILGEIKADDCLDILQKASVHKFVNVRRMAISAMGKIGDKQSEMALIRALSDENPQVITYAIKALKKINSKKSENKIKELYEKSKNKSIKAVAKEFLHK